MIINISKRMKTFNRIIILSLILFGAGSLKAQNQLALSLDSAIQFALTHNKTLINSQYAIENSNQKYKESVSYWLPQVSAAVDYSNFLGAEASLQLNPMAPPAVIEFNPTSNFKATATQIIFNGSVYVGIQLAQLAKDLSTQTYKKDELTVKEQTIQAYYIILVSERIMDIINKNIENAQQIYEKTNNLAKAGMIEETEAKKLSVMVTTVQNAKKSTERQIELGYNLLLLQLGLESDTSIKLTTGIDEISSKYIISKEGSETFNIQNNLDYKLIELQSKISKKAIDLKKANYLPSLVSFYSHTEKIEKAAFDMTPKNVLGLTLNIPIFSSGQRCAQLSQAKITHKITENSKALVKQQLTLQEKQLSYNYKNLYDQYINQKENTAVAKEVLDKMNIKYQQGLVSSLELTSANSAYLTAETTLTTTMLELLNAELALRKMNNNL